MTLRSKIEWTALTICLSSTFVCSCASQAEIVKKGPGPAKTINIDGLKIAAAEKVPVMQAPSQDKPLLIVYPRGGEIPTAKSFIVGSTLPGYKITVGGAPVQVNAQGFFAHVVSLIPGKNVFAVACSGPNGQVVSQEVACVREKPAPLMSAQALAVDKNSIQPKADVARVAGDMIEFSCRATPGARVTALIASANASGKIISVPMLCPSAVKKEASATAAAKGNMAAKIRAGGYGVNPGLSVAYGQAFQHLPAHREDYYVGVYRLQPEDSFVDAPITFKIAREGSETSFTAAAKITAIKQPMIARTLNDDTYRAHRTRCRQTDAITRRSQAFSGRLGR